MIYLCPMLQLTELRVQNLRNHVDQLTEEKHPDSQKLNQEVEILEQRWQKLQNLLHEHRKLLEIAVEFYQFCEQVIIVAISEVSNVFPP